MGEDKDIDSESRVVDITEEVAMAQQEEEVKAPQKASEVEAEGAVSLDRSAPLTLEILTECKRLKQLGNAAFKLKNWTEALAKYGEAMADESCTPEDRTTLLVNRALASLRVAEDKACLPNARSHALNSALEDAREAGKADPSNAKAHFREAQACMLLEMKEEAKLAIHRMWAVEPGNKVRSPFISLPLLSRLSIAPLCRFVALRTRIGSSSSAMKVT